MGSILLLSQAWLEMCRSMCRGECCTNKWIPIDTEDGDFDRNIFDIFD